jgi:glycogen operon protein
MRDEHWGNDQRQSLGALLNGELIPDRGTRGERISGDSLLLLFHSARGDTLWQLPSGWGKEWEVILDTAVPDEPPGARRCRGGEALPVSSRSLVILRRTSAPPPAD